jgi:hypothetical protein
MIRRCFVYEVILETHNPGDCAFIKSLLDAEKIVYFIQGEHVAPYLFNALPMRLMVRRDQADEARALLKGINLSYSYQLPRRLREADDNQDG